MAQRPFFVYLIHAARPGFTLENMTPEEKAAMLAHVAYLQQMMDAKKLILAGPCLDGAFGLGLFEADSAEDMRQIAERDPAVTSGAFTAEWHPFRLGKLRVPEEAPTA
jgi:uncharacterized protein YciI